MLVRRYARIDSPEELGLLIVCIAVTVAAKYFILKFYPEINNKLLNFIVYGIMFVIMIIWFALVPGKY